MPGTKNKVIEMIMKMPDNATLDDIMEELYFRAQVDEGLRELDEGKGIDHGLVKDKLGKWLNKKS